MILKNKGKIIMPRLLSLLFLVLCINTAAAQTAEPDQTRVTFTQKEMTLLEAFRNIEKQTTFRFALTGGKLDIDKKVSLPKTEYTVIEAVEYLLSGTGYTYTQRQPHFVIIPQEQPRRESVVASASQRAIIVDDRDLKQFVPENQYGADSVIRRTVEAGPFVYNVPERQYPTPGQQQFSDNEVPMRFSTAKRWQRSKFALKTNLLYGGAAFAPNLRAEFGLGNRTTLEVGASINAWNHKGTADNNKKLVHAIGMAEYRYWLCERFSGHFFGVHALGSAYNVSGYNIPLLFDKEYRYEGNAFGGGVSYGYMLPFAKRWAVEFNVGVGVMFMSYDKYGCDRCEEKLSSNNKTYFGPTRAGITLVFQIK